MGAEASAAWRTTSADSENFTPRVSAAIIIEGFWLDILTRSRDNQSQVGVLGNSHHSCIVADIAVWEPHQVIVQRGAGLVIERLFLTL